MYSHNYVLALTDEHVVRYADYDWFYQCYYST